MASGLTTAALRHRPRQALLLAALASVVSAAAALGPLYARAAEQSVLRTVLSQAPAEQRGVVVTSTSDDPPTSRALAKAIARAAGPGFGAPVDGADASVTIDRLKTSGNDVTGTSHLTYRVSSCRHLTISRGQCPTEATPDGVLVSERNATAFQLAVGQQLMLRDSTDPKRTRTVTVAGTYRPFDAEGDYWFGRGSTAAFVAPRPGQPLQPALDTMYTGWPTLQSSRFPDITTYVDLPLRVDRVRLDTVPDLFARTKAVADAARAEHASANTGLPQLVRASEDQRRQTRTVVPLIAVQLAVLGVVVLAFVCAAATESRRPELALARLRGQNRRDAAALLYRELGPVVLAGCVVGGLPGWLIARAAAARWLADGVGLELRWPVLAAIAASAVAALLAITASALPVLRQPLVSLLRRVPPRVSTLQVGIVEGALVAVAGAGVVTLLTAAGTSSRAARSPVALLAPGLLAVAGGVLLSQATVPLAGPGVRRALQRGRVASALATTQIARRPALRRLIAIITVACGLLTFGVDAWAVAERQRSSRAGLESGAAVVLDVDARDVRTLRDAVLTIDPKQRYATPVVTASSGTDAGPRSTAVEPTAFARIAHWGDDGRRPTPSTLRKLDAPTVPSLVLTGDLVTIRATSRAEGISAALNEPPPKAKALTLALDLTAEEDGRRFTFDLGPELRQGTGTYVAAVPCSGGCLLHRIDVERDFGAFDGEKFTITINRFSVSTAGGALTAVDLGPDSDTTWQPVDDANTEVTVDSVRPLSFSGDTYGTLVTIQRGDSPVQPPVLGAGQVLDHIPVPGEPQPNAVAPDLDGIEAQYDRVGRLPYVPRSGDRGVLVNLDLVLPLAGPRSAQATYAVWLAADDATRERRLVAALGRRGVVVTHRDSIRDHERALASQGPTLALRLTLLAGLVALLIACAVLVVGVVTSLGSRARDLAGLRLVGVPVRVIRSATVREHVAVSVLGTLAGTALGVFAAQIALPRIPLAATRGPHLPPSFAPAWNVVLSTTLVALVLLVIVSVSVGRALASAATPDRLRDER